MKMDAQLVSASVLSVDHTVTVFMVSVIVTMDTTLMLCQIVLKVKFIFLNRSSKEKTHVKGGHMNRLRKRLLPKVAMWIHVPWTHYAQFHNSVICTYFISLHLDCPPCDEHSHCDDTADGICICDEGYSPDLDSKCVKGIKQS